MLSRGFCQPQVSSARRNIAWRIVVGAQRDYRSGGRLNPIAPQSMLAALPSSLSKLLPSEQSQGASTDTRMRGFHSSAASQCDELGVVNKHTFQQQADNVSKGAHAQSAKHPFSVGGAIRALFPVPKKGVPALTKDQHVGRGSISTPRTAEEAW